MYNETSEQDAVIWWEKTVEYKFIVDCIKKNIISDISPLSGKQERMGDAIFSLEDAFDSNDKLFIVEFKKELTTECFAPEYGKFIDEQIGYQKAKKCLTGNQSINTNESHYLIAAEYVDNDFKLVIRDYFEFETGDNKSLESAFHSQHGMSVEDFKLYALSFSSHKDKRKGFCHFCLKNDQGGTARPNPGGDDNPDNPDGGISQNTKPDGSHTTLVIGINAKDKRCKVIPLELLGIKYPGNDSSQDGKPYANSPLSGTAKIITYENFSTAHATFSEDESQHSVKEKEAYHLAD